MNIVFVLVVTCLSSSMVMTLVRLMAGVSWALSPRIGTQTTSRPQTRFLSKGWSQTNAHNGTSSWKHIRGNHSLSNH